MSKFKISDTPINIELFKEESLDPRAGGFVSFEGWVRNRNEGRDVTHLEYQAYDSLAIKEGDRVIAEALPAAKVQKVQELQRDGHVVAMIGDGVNDSPALAQADVGLSLGTGAEIAAEASDMVLVKGNVTDVCTALDLSKVIFRRIKVSL